MYHNPHNGGGGYGSNGTTPTLRPILKNGARPAVPALHVQHQPAVACTSSTTVHPQALPLYYGSGNSNGYGSDNNRPSAGTVASHTPSKKCLPKQQQQVAPHLQTPLKLVMVGLGGVGKSALTIQFVQQYFKADYDPTIADSYTKCCFVDDALYKVQVLDTAGQDEHAALRDVHLRAGDGFLLVFSVTSRASLHYVLGLRRLIERLKDRDHFPMILVGNKSDLHALRQVARAEAEQVAAQLQLAYVECSAKFRHNVDQVFHALIRQIRQFRYLERRGHNSVMEAEDQTDQKRYKKKTKKKDKTCRIQ